MCNAPAIGIRHDDQAHDPPTIAATIVSADFRFHSRATRPLLLFVTQVSRGGGGRGHGWALCWYVQDGGVVLSARLVLLIALFVRRARVFASPVP